MTLQVHIPEHKIFMIDDAVEGDPEYKKGVDAIILNYYPTRDIAKMSNDYLENPLSAFANSINEVYQTVRKRVETTFRNQLVQSLEKGENVVLETIGQNIPPYLPISTLASKKYRIILAYSFVPIRDLVERVHLRGMKSLVSYMNDKHTTGPHLTPPTVQFLLKRVDNIRDFLLTFHSQCEHLFQEGMESVMIFDNSGDVLNYVATIETCNQSQYNLIKCIVDIYNDENHGNKKSDHIKILENVFQCLKQQTVTTTTKNHPTTQKYGFFKRKKTTPNGKDDGGNWLSRNWV